MHHNHTFPSCKLLLHNNEDEMKSLTVKDILNFLINRPDGSDQCEFLMEVTDKTMADVKVSVDR